MNFETLKRELDKKLQVMSKDDFEKFVIELRKRYYKLHYLIYRDNEW
jgi:hypothetical protein